MKKAAIYCSMGIFLLAWTGLSFGVTLQGDPPRTLIVEDTDSNMLTISDSGGISTIPDVTVDSVTYFDITTITGTMRSETIVIAEEINAATTWNLTGSHSGTVTIEGYSAVYFSAIDSLVGAAGEDTFIFPDGVEFEGTLDGGLGTNTLDYSAFTVNIIVNLAEKSATGTAGISNIQDVIGGTKNDLITGDEYKNTFTGGPGKDLLTGGDGDDTIVETRDANFVLTNKALTIGTEIDTLSGIEAAVLTGGPGTNTLDASTFSGSVILDGADGNDTLLGGSGDDVLIGGAGNNAIEGNVGVDTVLETCDADFDLTVSGLLSWTDRENTFYNEDTFKEIENFHLIGGPTDNWFDISVSALAGASVLVEGDAGYDTLTLEPPGIDVHLTSGGITIDPGPPFVNYETVEAVNIDGDAQVNANVTLNAREYNLDSLIVTNNSVLTLAADVSATAFQGVKITTSSDLEVVAGSRISGDGQGHGPGQGPGAGGTPSEEFCGGGGGYGGQGGNCDEAAGGVTYGSDTEPTDLGSGGGGNEGGAGGGAIFLDVYGTLFVYGGIVCEGAWGAESAGGGSGGSIYLMADNLVGSGSISANGGDGGQDGGGGGGGRISFDVNTFNFFGPITVSGGRGSEPGGKGTIYPAYGSTPTADPGGPYLTAVTAAFTVDGSASSDPDGDLLTYTWKFDDNTKTGVAPLFLAPADAGIYQLKLTVDDGQDGSDTASTSVVVYDPSAGFVTGGGWIDSPEGAYANDPSLIGEATFGFVSKYKKGAAVPTGNTEFEFKAGDLYFHSTSYDWLVVTGSDYARFKGSGTINGGGDYKFMLWAGDGEPDTFRIRIWEEDETTGDEIDIYDNGFDQGIGGGSIVVHTKEN